MGRSSTGSHALYVLFGFTIVLASSEISPDTAESLHEGKKAKHIFHRAKLGNEVSLFQKLESESGQYNTCNLHFSKNHDGDIKQKSHLLQMTHQRQPNGRKLEPYVGMILEVHGDDYDADFDYGIETRSKGDVNIYHRICNGSKLIASKESYTTHYELIEVIREDLGITEIHNHDFAYRPVFSLPYNSNAYNKWKDDGYWWDNKIHESSYERTDDRAFAGGSNGEVWRAKRRCRQMMVNVETSNVSPDYRWQDFRSQSSQQNSCNEDEQLIMKRLMVGKSYKLMEAGLREIYFGDILARNTEYKSLFTAYIDHFFHHQSGDGLEMLELWIVFRNAGPSLRSLLYSPVENSSFLMYQHSAFWTKLRSGGCVSGSTDDTYFSSSSVALTASTHFKFVDKSKFEKDCGDNVNGKSILKAILSQLLTSAAKLHERGIIHRDIKPSNIMCDVSQGFAHILCRLGDFSSAYDDYSAEYLYSQGPSRSEQTDEYAPPEVLFSDSEWIPFDDVKPESYDSWSIGIVILELLLGTPHVFSVDKRTTAVLTMKLKDEGASDRDIEKALYLAALAQFCIYRPASSSDWPLREGDPLFKASMAKTTCDITDFHNALRARDPLGIGFSEALNPLLDLVGGLLAWNPKERLTAADALKHYYFDSGENGDRTGTAVEQQMLDPGLDMNGKEEIVNEFTCPKCGRTFDNLQSCQVHARTRKHAKFCLYDRSNLPKCLNAHSMLPSHPTSGYCDIQGRRRTIEDFHTIHLHENHQFFGVFDGHNTNFASKYASSALYKRIVKPLSNIDRQIGSEFDWKSQVELEMTNAFADLHDAYLDVMKNIPSTMMNKSGTTATALFLTKKAVIIASVGDSRAVLSVGASFHASVDDTDAIQLTVDHVASNPFERKEVERRGSYVSEQGGTLRVNGTLVLTRSIGDAHLAQYLSRSPHVTSMTVQEVTEKCRHSSLTNYTDEDMPCFIILASDGLWDVFSNKEAVQMVLITLQPYGQSWKEKGAMQEAAERLTQEAYVRGSMDNIGVCVVAVTT